MVFHHLSKRRPAMVAGIYSAGPPWVWNLLCRPRRGSEISSTGPPWVWNLLCWVLPWVWNEKISKKFLFSLQFIQQK